MDVEPVRPIQTERLMLRSFTDADFDALYAYQSREDVTRYLLWGARTEDEVRIALGKKLGSTALVADEDVIALAVVARDTGALIGDFILQLLSREHRCGEIGYVIHPDHQGRGYATEAGTEILRIAFEQERLHRVIGRAEPRNTASTRVLEKLGMRREAHFVENEYIKGEWQSEVVYAILEGEWRARR